MQQRQRFQVRATDAGAHATANRKDDTKNAIKRKLEADSYTQHGPDPSALFRKLKTSRRRELTKEEMERILRRAGPHQMSETQLQSLLAEADKNGDGNISYTEFRCLLGANSLYRIKQK